jgi:dienelactone hydrolase
MMPRASLSRILCTAVVLLPLVWPVASQAQPLFGAAHVGAPGSGSHAELYMPAAAGAGAAVIVLHGWDGVGPHYREWAKRLQSWGYAALLVDSFRPRGKVNVCNRGREVPPRERAADVFRATEYLRTLPALRGGRIGVIGFSHGGWTALHAVLRETVEAARGTPLQAAVAFYPGCEQPTSPLVTDTLILIGEADDWTPWQRCQRWRDTVQTAGRVARIKVYPGARHGFDSSNPLHTYAGHLVGRDPVAAKDAEAETPAFLAERLTERYRR